MSHGASRMPRYTSPGHALRNSAPASPGIATSARRAPESRASTIAPRPRSLAAERKRGTKRSISGAAPFASTRTIAFFGAASGAAPEAAGQGLSHVVIEKGALLDTLVNWPTHTIFFSTPELLEIGGHPFVTASGKPTRREGLVYYRKVAEREGLAIRLHERVLSAEREGGLFRVRTASGVEAARAVVVATGFYANPNLLDVPGEDLPKVSHYYTEPFA